MQAFDSNFGSVARDLLAIRRVNQSIRQMLNVFETSQCSPQTIAGKSTYAKHCMFKRVQQPSTRKMMVVMMTQTRKRMLQCNMMCSDIALHSVQTQTKARFEKGSPE